MTTPAPSPTSAPAVPARAALAARLAAWLLAAALLVGAGVGLGAWLSRDHSYAQDSPQAVLASAKEMVERADAKSLPRLFYAENDDMRGLYKRLGVVLGHLQDLGTELNRRFPTEIAKLKTDAQAAAKKGQVPSLFSQLTGQKGFPSRRSLSRIDQRKQQELFSAAVKRLFADPYAFIEESSDRLTTTMVNDDLAAILWDSAPILPPVGLTIKRDDSRGRAVWAVVLPTNLPVLSRYIPRTPDEYKVLGSLLRTFDNVIVDVTRDVQSGRIASLDDVSKKAGEKAFIPAAMTFYAYAKVVEARAKKGG